MNHRDTEYTEVFEEPSAELTALSGQVTGAAIEVHRVLGPGFLEAVYEEALCVELAIRGLRFSRQVAIAVDYKGHQIGEGRLDLLVENVLIVELKAVEDLSPNSHCTSFVLLENNQTPLRFAYQLQRTVAQKRHSPHCSLKTLCSLCLCG